MRGGASTRLWLFERIFMLLCQDAMHLWPAGRISSSMSAFIGFILAAGPQIVRAAAPSA